MNFKNYIAQTPHYTKLHTPSGYMHGVVDDATMFDFSEKYEVNINPNSLVEDVTSRLPLGITDFNKGDTGLKLTDIASWSWIIFHIRSTSKDNISDDVLADAITLAQSIKTRLTDSGFFGIGILNVGIGTDIMIPINTDTKNKSDYGTVSGFIRAIAESYKTDLVCVDTKNAGALETIPIPDSPIFINGFKDDYCHTVKWVEEADAAHPNSMELISDCFDDSLTASLFVVNKKGPSLCTDAIIKYVAKRVEVFREVRGQCYAITNYHGNRLQVPLSDKKGNHLIRKIIQEKTNVVDIPDRLIESINTHLEVIAYDSEPIKLHHRSKYDPTSQTILYNLGNNKTIRITKYGWTIIPTPEKVFFENSNDLVQVAPVNTSCTELLPYLEKYFNLPDKNNDTKVASLLYIEWLITAYFGSAFPHGILAVTGSKGSAKSSFAKGTTRIINPTTSEVSVLLTKVDDVAIRLSKSIVTNFDNVGYFSKDISNLLCMAVTGADYTKRKLYKDSDEVNLSLNSSIIINGIDISESSQSDLLDRSLFIELHRIQSNNWKTEAELNAEFTKDLPKILGAIFDTLSKMLALDEGYANPGIRLADFCMWAGKAAKVLGFSEQDFAHAFQNNADNIVLRALESQPLWTCVKSIMKNRHSYDKQVQEAYEDFKSHADSIGVDRNDPLWPKSSSAFSFRLNTIQSELSSMGYDYSVEFTPKHKILHIVNNNFSGFLEVDDEDIPFK